MIGLAVGFPFAAELLSLGSNLAESASAFPGAGSVSKQTPKNS